MVDAARGALMMRINIPFVDTGGLGGPIRQRTESDYAGSNPAILQGGSVAELEDAGMGQ